MKLIKITIKSITKFQLNKLLIWNNDQKITRFFKSKNKTIEQIKNGLIYPGTYHFMIVKNNKYVGYIFFTRVGNGAYVTIMIDKKYWGKNYAKQAMVLLENKGRRLKIKKFMLEVYPKNKRAFSLYKNLNYVMVGDNESRVIMEKEL